MMLSAQRLWYCPNCDTKSVTHEAQPHTRFHTCSGLAGLTAPMVPAGTKAKVVVHEREDYIGSETVQLHEGRPIMNITTEREDGSNDVMVFAPVARVKVEER